MTKKWPAWSPGDLKDWFDKYEGNGNFPTKLLTFLEKLATDSRMHEFWDWHMSARKKDSVHHRTLQSTLSIGMSAWSATRLPGKPGDLPPAQRNAYFDKVRKHSLALMELLRDTKFERDDMREIDEHELEASLKKNLWSWGDDEDESGHVVAFTVTRHATYEMSYDYPNSHLVQMLADLFEWTHWDDHWDGNPLKTSTTVRQANAESAKTIHFTCTMFERFKRHGIEVPFPLLATFANVALNLTADGQVDEDAVRKQVRRYQQRELERMKQATSDLPSESGHNLGEIDFSVLSDPF